MTCECEEPVPVTLGLFGGMQCRNCHRHLSMERAMEWVIEQDDQ